MINYANVLAYREAILVELYVVENAATHQMIQDLLSYADKKEKEKKEAESRDLRPRPLREESAAYYRELINLNDLPSDTLRNLIEGLLQFVASMEEQLQY